MPIRHSLRLTALLTSYLDNIVYRHEIGMDSFGRLRSDSTIVRAHAAMLAVLAAIAVSYAVSRWRGVYATSGLALGTLAIGTYPLAFRRAFISIRRERLSGALEQLYMTPLTHTELFEGKFFGSLAPLFEIRRYLLAICVAFCAASYWTIRGPAWLFSLTIALATMNHFGFSAYLGTLAGLKAGLQNARLSDGLLREWHLNPYPTHAFYAGKYLLYLSIPLMIIFYLGGIATYPAYVLMLLIPALSSADLRNYELRERASIAHRFRSIFSFEPTESDPRLRPLS